MIFFIFLFVPTGTVDFVIIIQSLSIFLPIVLAASSTYDNSEVPSNLAGVPTAINIILAFLNADLDKFLKEILPLVFADCKILSKSGS